MSRTIVTFKSSRFNTSETKDYFINPECFGDDTAKWMAEGLEQLGANIEKDKEFPGQEDFGWYFNFNNGSDKFCLVVGSQEVENNQRRWILWIERHCGFIGSLLGGRKRNIPSEVPESVHKVLSGSNEISEIKWYEEKEFDVGDESNASDQP